MRREEKNSTRVLLVKDFIWIIIAITVLVPGLSLGSWPERKPLSVEQRVEASDVIFVGKVHKLRFLDDKNRELDPSHVKGIAGSTAEVEVNEMILDPSKRLTRFVLFPLGASTASARERLEQYEGKTFVFFGRFLYEQSIGDKKFAFIRPIPDNGTDDIGNVELVRKAVTNKRVNPQKP